MRYYNLRCRSLSRVIVKHCDDCSIGDPSQKHHECISRTYLEWIEHKFDGMLHEVDFNMSLQNLS